jgi:hypothetical protein
MALSGSVAANINMVLTSALDLSSATSTLSDNNSYTFTNGTGANNVNNIFSDQRTLAASATEDLDLAGSLTDAFGNTITFTKIKALLVVAASGNTNDVVVGGAGANGFDSWVSATGDSVLVKPGGCLLIVAPDATGYAVTAGTGDLLTITNSAGSTSVTYDVVIAGVE